MRPTRELVPAALVSVSLLLFLASPSTTQQNALSLGGQGYATAGHDPALSLGNQTLTIEAWIKHDGASDADAVIVSKRSGATVDYELRLVGAGEEVAVAFVIWSNVYAASSSIGVPAGRWTHVAGSYDGTAITILVDGVEVGRRNTSGNTRSSTSPLVVGANESGDGRFFSGEIDELRIWDVPSGETDVRGRMNGPVAATSPGLRAYYPFSGSGADAVGSNDLQLMGNAGLATPGLFPVPPDLYVTPGPGPGTATLLWLDRGAATGAGATGFSLYRSTDPSGGNRQAVQTFPAGTTSAQLDGLEPGGTQVYQITAMGQGGAESDFSPPMTVTPSQLGGGGSLRLGGGSYGRVSHRPSLSLGSAALTVEAWIKHDGQSDEDAVILSKRQDFNVDYELRLSGSGQEVPVAFSVWSGSYVATSDVGVPAGLWTHVAGSYDGTHVSVYVNGRLAGRRSMSGNTRAAAVPLVIGAGEGGNGQFFSGQIDEVRIWDRVLGGATMPLRPHQRLVGNEEGLRFYHRFDDAPLGAARASHRGSGSMELVDGASLVPGGAVPAPPVLFGRPTTAGIVELAWEPLPGGSAQSYELYRSTTPAGGDRQRIATHSGGVAGAQDTGVAAETLYFYHLAAVADGRASDLSPPVPVTVTPLREGSALRLGGSGFVRSDHRPSLTLGNQSLTVEAWIRHDGTSAADAVIVTKRHGAVVDYELALAGTGDAVPVVFRIYSNTYQVVSPEPIPANTWTHVAGTYNGSTITLFVDGEVAGTRATSGTTRTATAPLVIGADENGAGRFFSGEIDELRIWDRSRDRSDIRQTMDRVLMGNEDGLRAYFRFDERGGTTTWGSSRFPMTASLMGDARFSTAGSDRPIIAPSIPGRPGIEAPPVLERPVPADLAASDQDRIRSMVAAHEKYVLDRDWDRLVADYGPAVVILPPDGSQSRGHDALRQIQDGLPPLDSYALQLQEVGGGGRHAYALLSWTSRWTERGRQVEDSGRDMWILQKQADGSWLITLRMSNRMDQDTGGVSPTRPPGRP